MAKIPTPSLATLINDLPKLDGSETGKNIIVTTNQGLRKVDWEEFKAWNNYLIGIILAIPYGSFIEKGFVPLLGGILKPSWFKDSLAILKRRCPIWVDQATGNVKLPNLQNIVLQMDYRLWAFEQQNDALQNIKGQFGAGNGGTFDGPFKYSDAGGAAFQTKPGAGGDPRAWVRGYFDTKNDTTLRTAAETRENTRNITWCVYAGELADPDPEHIFYATTIFQNAGGIPQDDFITWPYLRLYRPSSETEGIGFNSSIMERVKNDVDDPWNPYKIKKGSKK